MSSLSDQVRSVRSESHRKRVPFRDRFVSRWPEWITLALYAALVAFAICYHEPWSDEAQAWQLARNLSLFDLFHTYLRYEGSPGLWYFLLWVLSHLHVTYSGLHWICGGIGLLGASTLVLYAPFPRYIKLLLPFTFFLAFQYAVIARSYVLAPLLLFAIAALWRRNPIVVAVLLGLLGNVALHALAISGGLAIVYVIDWKNKRTRAPNVARTEKLLYTGLILLAFYIFAIWTVWPPADAIYAKYFVPGVSSNSPYSTGLLRAIRCFLSLCQGVTEPMPIAIPVWIAIAYSMHRKHCLFYLIPAVLLVSFSAIYLSFWHAGLVIPLMITVFWIAGMNGPELKRPVTCEAAALLAAMAYLFAIQLGWTVHAIAYDHFHDYSPDLATARFLAPYVEAGDSIAVTHLGDNGALAFNSVGILPYFPRQIYMNQEKPFWWWSTRDHTEANFINALRQQPAIILLEFQEGRPFDPARDPSGQKTLLINGAGYVVTHAFCGQQPERFAFGVPTCHLIFQKDTVDGSPVR